MMAPSYGENLVHAVLEEEKRENATVAQLSTEHDHVLKSLRVLVADLCQTFSGGHPGAAMDMMAIGVALWRYVMRYAPHDPNFFNRDRFVLSNGHACLFQYIFLHLTGYRDMTFEQLQSYHSSRPDGLCPGHPEIEHEGIEVTTGPLGQGVANAVGLAAASKQLAAQYNRPGFDVVSNHIWCMVGDACLQEGVGLEAISLAGHWALDNLTVIYDNNQVTCDGAVDLVNTEDINTKMRASGWTVLDVLDGCFDVDTLVQTLQYCRAQKGRPTFVNVRTIIGVGSAVAGDAVAHGAALGPDHVATLKQAYGFDPAETLVVSDELRAFFSQCLARGERLVQDWNKQFAEYTRTYPDPAAELQSRLRGESPEWKTRVPSEFPSAPLATRASSGLVMNHLVAHTPSIMTGTADLTPSVNMLYKDHVPFLSPAKPPSTGPKGSYAGRYVHYGIREHAMCAIANGLAAYHPGMILPITSSFFMFYLYAAPAVRMGALMRLQVIHAATHDSIGMGEDGPTHQPLELAALYRAMPNLLYIRPADSEETAGAWIVALNARETPSIISTSRHKVPQLAPRSRRDGVARGAYVLEDSTTPSAPSNSPSNVVESAPASSTSSEPAHERQDRDRPADVTLIGVGAELHLAVEAAQVLRETHHLSVRVVSFPCLRLFEQQPRAYRRDVLQRHAGVPAIVVEPYIALGWERYADAGVNMSTARFGQSLPGPKAYEFFGFTTDKIVDKVLHYLQRLKTGDALLGEFEEL